MKEGRLFIHLVFPPLNVRNILSHNMHQAYYFMLTVSNKLYSEYLSYSVRSVNSKLLSITYGGIEEPSKIVLVCVNGTFEFANIYNIPEK